MNCNWSLLRGKKKERKKEGVYSMASSRPEAASSMSLTVFLETSISRRTSASWNWSKAMLNLTFAFSGDRARA